MSSTGSSTIESTRVLQADMRSTADTDTGAVSSSSSSSSSHQAGSATAAAAPSTQASATGSVAGSAAASSQQRNASAAARSGSIVLATTPTASCSHINVCRPWISWKKGNISEYVSKPRVFFDHLHHQIVLFTGAPPNKMWRSDRATQTWLDYPLHLPPHNDIIGAQFSPDRTHVALRVSDKEVKCLSTATGEVVTARSCRGTSSRMISVHWLNDPALAKTAHASSLFLLFVTNAGVELYELTSDKSLLSAPAATPAALKLKHIKTATYNIVYHWILLDENVLLLVDTKNVFQAYRISSKTITKLCKFELDCSGTSLNPPAAGSAVAFHREQICLVWLYGRMVIVFINEVKGQMHLLSMAPPPSDEMEQSFVFELYSPGKYDVSVLDNVLCVHNSATRVSMLFDTRSEGKTTITEPLPIGPPLATAPPSAATNGLFSMSSGGKDAAPSSSAFQPITFFDPASLASSASAEARPSPGMASLAPASFHPYVKWTFLAPCYVWESTGDQQQGNLWTLHLNLQQIAFSWPNSKRARLVDFLLKRNTIQAKQLILQIILQIVCTEPTSLALLSRLFSLLNRMNYDHRMNPNAALPAPISLASLPLLPMFSSSNPPSAASTAPNSVASSPAMTVPQTRATSHSVSPYGGLARPPQFAPVGAGGATQAGSPLAVGALPSFGTKSGLASPPGRLGNSRSFSVANSPAGGLDSAAACASTHGGATAFPGSAPSVASAAAALMGAAPLSFDLDDSLSVLSSEMLDIPALQAQPLTLEHNLHGYMLISQMDVFLHVFERARPYIPLAQLIPVVVEYLRSIHRHFLKTEDILNDLLVSLLLQAGRAYEFHQYLQYHILNDSLPIANRLISVAPVYPPAYQLGIDMLYRLNQLPRLIRVLLQHHQVLGALQLIPSFRAPFLDTPGLTARDFLSVARDQHDSLVFYHCYRFFENRNAAIRGSPTFIAGDGCDEFVQQYQEQFGAATGATVQGVAQVHRRQFINLGDDDDEDGEDEDVEYDTSCGPKPSPFHPNPPVQTGDDSNDAEGEKVTGLSPSLSGVAVSSSGTASSTAAAASSTGRLSVDASLPDASAADRESVYLPSPLDLSTTIPSVGFSDAAESEDAAAESGLGATGAGGKGGRAPERTPSPDEPAESISGIDGSFLGAPQHSAAANEAAAAAAAQSKPKKSLFGSSASSAKFQPAPAM